MLKLQYFGHLIWKANSLEKTLILEKMEGKRRGWQRMRSFSNITNSMDMSLSKLQKIVKDKEGWRAAGHGATKSQTGLSEWTITAKRDRARSLVSLWGGLCGWHQLCGCPGTNPQYQLWAPSLWELPRLVTQFLENQACPRGSASKEHWSAYPCFLLGSASAAFSSSCF